MRYARVALIAVILTLTIRIMLLMQADGLSAQAYETLLQVEHIKETGLLLTESSLIDGIGTISVMPVFYYLVAFLALFLETEIAAVILSNFFLALLPIAVMLLAKETTRHTGAIRIATIASAFLPLLYAESLVTASPLSLAIPAMLMAFYHFIRLSRTPKDQAAFVFFIVLATFTHPVTLLLLPAMIGTMILTYVQKTKYSIEMTEATIFTSLFILWANIVVFKDVIQLLGSDIVNISTTLNLPAQWSVLIGVIPLIIGLYGAFVAFTEEKNVGAHALVALAGSVILALMTQTLPADTSLLLLSIIVTILAANGIEELILIKKKSRIAFAHTFAYILLLIAFVFSSITPSIALGLQSYEEVPREEEIILQALIASDLQENIVLWNQEYAAYLMYNGFTVVQGSDISQTEEGTKKYQLIQQISEQQNELRIIEILTELNAQTLIVPRQESLPLTGRCFDLIVRNTWEVYNIRCTLQ